MIAPAVLFFIVFAYAIEKYAIGLGYSVEQAKDLIKRSIRIYTGGLSFDDYRYLLNRKD